jgi:hypothetical protein
LPALFRWTVALLVGALVATVGDHLHVVYGVLFYPRPVLFQQAWWVFPLFVGACLAMLSGSESVRGLLSGARVPPSLPDAALATGAFFIAYAFTAVAAELPNLVLVVLGGTWLVRVRRLPRWVVLFGLLAAACGVGFESALSALEEFKYVNPDFLGVPRWLAGIYLHASIAGVWMRSVVAPPR